MNYINHYQTGAGTVEHKGKLITISDSVSLSNYLASLESVQIEVGTIPPGYEHRPDRISELFYGTVTKDWMLVMFNNIKDPFQELNVGDTILLPMI